MEKVDAVVFRVMHGWMTIEEITKERLHEAADIAHRFGADTVVFVTIPFTNNVLNASILEGVSRANEMIWDTARTWRLVRNDTTALVLDYGTYSNHVIWANARHIGYDVSDPLTASDSVFDAEGPGFLFERLDQETWPPSIPHVCAKIPTHRSHCDRNWLFSDGMHFCTETLSARIGSGVACLLGCVYNRRGGALSLLDTHEPEQREKGHIDDRLRSCERQCNRQFMSVRPVRESWINTTLASFAGI